MSAAIQCRQCGEPVPHDREGWATPMCYGCLSPIKGDMRGAVEVMAPSAYIVGYSTLLGTTERKK